MDKSLFEELFHLMLTPRVFHQNCEIAIQRLLQKYPHDHVVDRLIHYVKQQFNLKFERISLSSHYLVFVFLYVLRNLKPTSNNLSIEEIFHYLESLYIEIKQTPNSFDLLKDLEKEWIDSKNLIDVLEEATTLMKKTLTDDEKRILRSTILSRIDPKGESSPKDGPFLVSIDVIRQFHDRISSLTVNDILIYWRSLVSSSEKYMHEKKSSSQIK